jgi:hypothetical protein
MITVGRFEFDLNTADIITMLAASGQKSIDDYLTRPGIALARAISHMATSHPDMGDNEFLLAIRPIAYSHLVNEWT